VKIRDEGLVRNKAVYLAIGIRPSGEREVLGLWIEQTEGAKFWLRVMNEIKARGTNDVLIAVVDGLKGFPEAITTVFPEALVQTCIVYLIRYTMQFASWKERKAIAAALKPIYRADHADAARLALEAFDEPQVSGHRTELATQLGSGHSILRLPGRGPENHLHHQRDREPQRVRAQGDPQQGAFPERSGRHQTDLAGTTAYH
jgi:transposase-like protein